MIIIPLWIIVWVVVIRWVVCWVVMVVMVVMVVRWVVIRWLIRVRWRRSSIARSGAGSGKCRLNTPRLSYVWALACFARASTFKSSPKQP